MPSWQVIFQPALDRWEQGAGPTDAQVLAFLEWVLRCMDIGPPGAAEGAVRVPLDEEELFVYRVPQANAVVTYYVIASERLVIVKEIDSA